MLRIGVLAACLGLAGGACAQFTERERSGLSDALFLANLEAPDLIKARAANGSEWLRNLVNDPSKGVAQLEEFRNAANQRNIAQVIGLVRTSILSEPATLPGGTPTTADVPAEIPEVLRPSVKRLVEEVHLASDRIRKATEKLSPAERRMLIEGLPRLAAPGIKFDFVRLPMPDPAIVAALLAKVDLPLIRYAGERLARAAMDEIPRLTEVAKSIPPFTKVKSTIQGVVVEIGGTGPDQHDDTDAALCLDLGGNDRYTGRYGAGVGYASLLIDLSGDDFYGGPDLANGAGVLGVGIACDMGGDDRIKGKSIGTGSGIAGVGAWLKDNGDDDYRSIALSQGFGFHGIGILLDSAGEDGYRLGVGGQGAAKAGGIGLLFDKAGPDNYRSGGLTPHPFMTGSSISHSQGAADGAGTLGMLIDNSGGDAYLGDAKSQGFGAREGTGALLDAAGWDVYIAGHDAQCSANLSGAGYLLDSSGDDLYSVRQGNGHGYASSNALAVFLDRSGSDLYSAQDSRPATAAANGAAIFVDSEGDDRYLGPPGVGSLARGGGSMGLFVDLTGADQYAVGLANQQARSESNWGVALDSELRVPIQQSPEPPKPGTKPLPADDAMETLYARAIADDRAAIDELTAIGEPALRWLLGKKLDLADDATVALISWLAIQIGGPSEDLCVAAIDITKEHAARAAIQICQEAGHRRAGPRIVEAIDKPGLARVAVRAAGALQIAEAVDKLIALANEGDLKKPALIALSQIGDARATPLMQASIESSDADLRLAAVLFFAAKPDEGLALGTRLVGSPNERVARTAVELLAKIGTQPALSLVGKALSDTRRGVQIQAMSALEGRVPREFWPAIVELRKSADPLVKAVALRLDLGR
jgi:HEAT repeat protein